MAKVTDESAPFGFPVRRLCVEIRQKIEGIVEGCEYGAEILCRCEKPVCCQSMILLILFSRHTCLVLARYDQVRTLEAQLLGA